MNKEITKAMAICAEEVRETSCVKCLHYEECAAHGSPLSMLGRYIAWLNLKALKPISNKLNPCCDDMLNIVARVPDDDEMKKGAYVVIRAYSDPDRKHLLFRLNLQGTEGEEELESLIFNAYAKSQRKRRK